MARRRKSKKRPVLPRGARGAASLTSMSSFSSLASASSSLSFSRIRRHHDLNVPLPPTAKSSDGRRRASTDRRAVIERLFNTGYGVVALSHTVYGRPDPTKDNAFVAIPRSFVDGRYCSSGSRSSSSSSSSPSPSESPKVADAKKGAKRKAAETEKNIAAAKTASKAGSTTASTRSSDAGGDGPLILRRLNVVIEDASDVVRYSSAFASNTNGAANGTGDDVLDLYDVVAISARSDSSFSAACSDATAADVIVLDYSAGRGGVQLPHRIRPSDVRSASDRGVAFELSYGPAILDPAKRKALVRTALELRIACLAARRPGGPAPRIVLTSGSRVGPDGIDRGPMALRTPGDMSNVMKVVLGFDDCVSYGAMSTFPAMVVERGRRRRTGAATVVGVGAGAVKTSAVVTEVVGMTRVTSDALSLSSSLRWGVIDEDAPLAGDLDADLNKKSRAEMSSRTKRENVPKKKKKLSRDNDSDADARKKVDTLRKNVTNTGGWNTVAVEDEEAEKEQDDIGLEDGFIALS